MSAPLAGAYYDDPLIDELTAGVANLGITYSNGTSTMNGGQYSIYASQPSIAIALVQTVPVPPALLLFISGLTGILFASKRKASR